MKKYTLLLLLLLGFVFRIVISFQNYSGDVNTLMIWGEDAVKNGLPGLYDRNFEKAYGHISPNYPPLSIFFIAFLYLIKGWIYQFAWFLNLRIPFFPSNIIYFLKDYNYFPYLIKLPAILSDIGIAYVTYLFISKIIGKKKSNWPVVSAALVLFNPAYFYNSAYWGQTDSLPIFFVLLFFYLLIFSKKNNLSVITFIIALLVKQTTVVFTPLYILLFLRKSNFKQSLISLIISTIIFVIFFMPFYQKGDLFTFPFLTYWKKILLSPGIPYTSNHAFNFWYLLTGSRTILASSKFILDIPYEIWGFLITGFVTLAILISFLRKQGSRLLDSRLHGNDNSLTFYYAGFLIPFTSFLFLTKMHERHLILTLPFLLLLTYNNKFLLISYLFISLFNFLNMYHDWWSPEVLLLKYIFSNNIIINVLTIALISIFIFLILEYFGLKIKSKNKINTAD